MRGRIGPPGALVAHTFGRGRMVPIGALLGPSVTATDLGRRQTMAVAGDDSIEAISCRTEYGCTEQHAENEPRSLSLP